MTGLYLPGRNSSRTLSLLALEKTPLHSVICLSGGRTLVCKKEKPEDYVAPQAYGVYGIFVHVDVQLCPITR